MEQKLHTPEGVRDIYNKECKVKSALQKKLSHVLHLYGYQDIQTPTFEYYDVFRKEIGSTSTQELYKFFDRDGNILALRPDITPSIARAAATLFEEETMPVRLCYAGNTFINHTSYQGRLKENTQLGAELIGLDSLEADAEMLALVADGLKRVGLKEFQISIGHVDFIEGLMESTGLDDSKKEEIRTLIANRNYFGVEEILDENQVNDQVKESFRFLPALMGGEEVLMQAAKIAPNPSAEQAIARLQGIYRLLKIYGVEEHITFDMSMMGSYGYYSGIIFRAYTYGTGDAVVRGGRYDHLLAKFGKNTPSIGFAIIIDELMSALNRQKITVETSRRNLIVYTQATEQWAITMAGGFRAKGKQIELIKREAGEDREKYESYARRSSIVNLLYLRDDGKIEILNLLTNKENLLDGMKKN